ncbi:MAG TPA: cobalt ECF transporter T component CbiQ [Mycobacteriales bacterium]|nr:cobalt ECF transporter T component CbiQ [Mycobacteriales bacterium]
MSGEGAAGRPGGLVAGHYRDGGSPVHRLPPQCKIAALAGCVLVVVATPRGWFPAFGGYAAVLAAVAAVARVPVGVLVRRARVELPFVLFALALPFLAEGPRVRVAGLELSRIGLLGAWGILAKGTLGVVGSALLGATTRPPDIVAGLRRLRLPVPLVQVALFMLRYAEVVTAELHRMRIAQRSRGFDRRAPHRLRVLARTAGALFVRSFERGERVYLAMCSRGYTGVLPLSAGTAATTRQWVAAAVLPAAAVAVLVGTWFSPWPVTWAGHGLATGPATAGIPVAIR